MPVPKLSLLSDEDLTAIHLASVQILEQVGVKIVDRILLESMSDAGAIVDFENKRVRLPETCIIQALEKVERKYILYGRDRERTARFGYGECNLMSSPGQFAWLNDSQGVRVDPTIENVRQAAILGDALDGITVVGALSTPTDIPISFRDVTAVAELVRYTTKPTRVFPVSARSSQYVLEIYAAIAGGKEALKQKPMTEVLLDPISPLQFPSNNLAIARIFIEYGQPVCVTAMGLAGGTAPITLAGVLAQQNAEILAGIVIVQSLNPGHPVMYGGIPHIMDPRTSLISFGSPEQGIMALAMAQIAQSYGLPVYVNVNLSDSKRLDLQAGYEKMSGLIAGLCSGADLLGHAGIVGADQAGCLAWLVADEAAFAFARRVQKGLTLDTDHLAAKWIAEVGPGGNFMALEHTVRNLRQELWIPNVLWDRNSFSEWQENRQATLMNERIDKFVHYILESHCPVPIEDALEKEINRIVQAAQTELG